MPRWVGLPLPGQLARPGPVGLDVSAALWPSIFQQLSYIRAGVLLQHPKRRRLDGQLWHRVWALLI